MKVRMVIGYYSIDSVSAPINLEDGVVAISRGRTDTGIGKNLKVTLFPAYAVEF